MKHLVISIVLLCMFAVCITPANAARRPKKMTTEAVISTISKDSISIKSGQTTHTYKISSQTMIHLDGRKVDAKELKKGMHADVTVSQLDVTTASAIEASDGN